MNTFLLKNAFYLNWDGNSHRVMGPADILIKGNRIFSVGGDADENQYPCLDFAGRLIIPGLIQMHIHLCQTLMRGLADDTTLFDWLNQYILPYEAAHDEDSAYWSAILGIAELIDGGTTTIVDMATRNHTSAIFQAMADMGIRGWTGNMLMDRNLGRADRALVCTVEEGLSESERLMQRWHGAANQRLHFVFNPRFAPVCSDRLWQAIVERSRAFDIMIHTHAAETQAEVEWTRKSGSKGNIAYLAERGALGRRSLLAHGVWIEDDEYDMLAHSGTTLVHCPSANLKLGSGIASTVKWLERGIHTAIGADGAPCNNRLDAWQEMRLAALLQKLTVSPDALPASTVFNLTTSRAAQCLQLENSLGNIQPGFLADLTILNFSFPHSLPFNWENIVSTLIYNTTPANVTKELTTRNFNVPTKVTQSKKPAANVKAISAAVMIDGNWVKKDFKLILPYDWVKIRENAQFHCNNLHQRVHSCG